METLKNLIGGGGEKKEEEVSSSSAQEPISGVQGKGSVGEPFYAGNLEETNLSGKEAQEPISGVQGEGTAEKPFDAGNLDDQSTRELEATKAEQHTDSTSTETPANTDIPNLEKKPTIGGSRWFTTANPFSKTGSSGVEPEETLEPSSTPAALQSSTISGVGNRIKQDKSSSLPPNHHGEDVPPGQDSIVVDPTYTNMPNHFGDDGHSSGFLTDKGKGKARMTQEQAEQFDSRQDFPPYRAEQFESRPDFPSYKTESSSISTRRESVSTQYTVGTRLTYSTAETGASIAGSSRRASAAVHIVTSQGKPITAGGVPLGLPAMEERERRLSFSVPEDPEHDLPEANTTNTTKDTIEGSKHHDFASTPPRPTPVQAKSTAAHSSVPESEAGGDKLRRKSTIIHRAKDFGRRVRHSISK